MNYVHTLVRYQVFGVRAGLVGRPWCVHGGGRHGAAQLQEQVPQESGSCGTSWRHPPPRRSSRAPGEGKAQSMKSPGAQDLSHRPGKTSSSSLPGSLDSDRFEMEQRQGAGPHQWGRGCQPRRCCLFHPRANLPAQPLGRGSARGRQSKAMLLKGTFLQTRRT